MKIETTNLEGVFEVENIKFKDKRGVFVKTFHEGVFSENGLETDFKESFYSISRKGVLRGMHFQLPPCDHAKLIYVTEGKILDVVVDVRKNSPTFGRYFSTHLSSENVKSLYIAKGFAHGFLTLSNTATVVYLTSTAHSPEADSGIKWDSFGFKWTENSKHIISERDNMLPSIDDI